MKSSHALEVLATIMEYQWSADAKGFTFIPSLLPMSPWNKDKGFIYYSIIARLRGAPATNSDGKTLRLSAVGVLVHEVCHFIFYDIVARAGVSAERLRNGGIMYIAHETLAPVVMNQPELRELLQPHGYWGNPNLKPIILRDGTHDKNIVDFFSDLYASMHAEGKTFEAFVLRMLDIMFSLQPALEPIHNLYCRPKKRYFTRKAILRTPRYSGIESSSRKSFLAKSHLFGSDKKIVDRFLEKRAALWSAHGIHILKDPALLAEYSEPIVVEE